MSTHREITQSARLYRLLPALALLLGAFALPDRASAQVSAPVNVMVTADYTLSVTWDRGTGGDTPTGYNVHYTASSTVAHTAALGSNVATEWVDAEHTGTTTSQTITGLDYATTYRVRVAASAAGATSAWSASTTASSATTRPAPAPAAQSITIWSATLTLDVDSTGDYYGCDSSDPGQDNCSSPSVLTDDEFTYSGTAYTIDDLYRIDSTGKFTLALREDGNDLTWSETKAAIGSLTLYVDGTAFAVSSAENGVVEISWPYTPSPAWVEGQTVSVSLRNLNPSTDATLSALTAKSHTSAAGDFSALALSPSPFAATTTEYSALVPHSTTHVKLAPTLNELNATVKVSKDTLISVFSGSNSGEDSASIALTPGENVIRLEVTAQDGSTKNNYMVRITRQDADSQPIWAATLTVDESSGSFGCGGSGSNCASALTDDIFTYSGSSYKIASFDWDSSTDKITIYFRDQGDNDLVASTVRSGIGSLILYIDGTAFAVGAGVGSFGLEWPYKPTRDWIDGQLVSLSLGEASPPTLAIKTDTRQMRPGGIAIITAELDKPALANTEVTLTLSDPSSTYTYTGTAGIYTGTSGTYTYTYTVAPHPLTIANGARRSITATFTASENAVIGTVIRLNAIARSSAHSGLNATVDITIGSQTQSESLHQTALPEIARAVAGRVTGAISTRVGQVLSGEGGGVVSASLGGHGTLAGALQTHAPSLINDQRPLRDLLHGSNFVLPLNGDGGGGGSGLGSVSVWGSGEYRNLSGDSDGIEFDGDMYGAQIGVDSMVRDNLLAGVALSWSEGDLEYEDSNAGGGGGEGDYAVDVVALHPYIGGRSGSLNWWATLGYGTGEVEITPQTEQSASNDVTMTTLGAGGSGVVWSRAEDGTRVHLKGEFTSTRMDVERSAEVDSLAVDATLARVALEASRTRSLAGGGSLSPSLSLGARHDGGDGNTGTGAEVSGNLRYNNAESGVSTSISAHGLFGRSDYEEWGVQAVVRLSAGADGQGLSFVMRPGYGNNGGAGVGAGDSGQIWSHGLRGDATPTARDASGRLEMRMGYGLSTPGERSGLLTPWGGLALEGDGKRYRLGLDWTSGGLFSVRLSAERREQENADADHLLLLKGEARF